MDSEVVYLIILSMLLIIILYYCGLCYYGNKLQNKDNSDDEFRQIDVRSGILYGIWDSNALESQMAGDLNFPPKYSHGLSGEFEEPPPSYECAMEFDRISKIPKFQLDIETYI